MSRRFGKVALLLGGSSPEREISLRSGEQVAQALEECCEEVIRFDPGERSLSELLQIAPERAFVILHGGSGEDGRVQSWLELAGIPYTGSGPRACALAIDKRASLAIWQAAGLPVGKWLIADADCPPDALAGMVERLGSFPLFVKPNCGGSSVACGRADDLDQLRELVCAAAQADEQVLIEPLFAGAELSYALVEGETLPGVQITAESGFYDYQAKYESDRTGYQCPPPLPEKRQQQLRQLAERAFQLLGCRSWGRVDLLADDQDCKLLEVNTVPGMTSHSLVPKAAAAAGIGYGDLVAMILEQAQC
ncbi:MAG: D-alanine--D-alanine ligase [Betaproteobacteria bacterium]|nr:D-alanine--D-alanine ligase [Betaproteobacteria bacterium]